MRQSQKYRLENPSLFKEKLLQWAQQFQEIVHLDSNGHTSKYKSYEVVLAADAFTKLKTNCGSAFQKLETYRRQTEDWIFGYLGYDLKNDVEELRSENFDGLRFPDLFFFQPKKLFLVNEEKVEFHYLKSVEDEMEDDFEQILGTEIPSSEKNTTPIEIKPRIPKKAYLEKTEKILEHLHRGNIYEANFCQEFYAKKAQINALETYRKLNGISRPPFAAFLKLGEFHALSASPERYLKRTGNKIISQPIKGTARRSENPEEDKALAETLKNDPKEISENTMIVDLVRNDLSRTASPGSVSVEELCGLYSFEQVHQLISTVVSEVSAEISSVEILKTTFPMGSMTGAPKISAMNIIENLEETKRGLYSGAVGYFTPSGSREDFDFNVVIRSILYNSSEKYLSFSVGSAITAKSVPEKEYEECLVKAKAMRESLFSCKVSRTL